MSGAEFEGWAVVELFGFKTMAGRVSRAELCGAPMLKVEIPIPASSDFLITLRAPSAVYGLTPCTEAKAREVATRAARFGEDVAPGVRLIEPLEPCDKCSDALDAAGHADATCAACGMRHVWTGTGWDMHPPDAEVIEEGGGGGP